MDIVHAMRHDGLRQLMHTCCVLVPLDIYFQHDRCVFPRNGAFGWHLPLYDSIVDARNMYPDYQDDQLLVLWFRIPLGVLRDNGYRLNDLSQESSVAGKWCWTTWDGIDPYDGYAVSGEALSDFIYRTVVRPHFSY